MEKNTLFLQEYAQQDHVLLLHGLYMNAWIMLPLAHFLREYGFQTHTFSYYTVWQRLPQHLSALEKQVKQHYAQYDAPLHWVGHSLGGLVLRHFAAAFPHLVRGRIVTLGTPHQGSVAAEQLVQWGLQKTLLGGAYPVPLAGQLPPLPNGIELGSLAGNHGVGLGKLLGIERESDGTVCVAETYCEGMADHLVLPLSHTSLLFSRQAAEQTAHFLRHGKFAHQA